MRKIRTVIGVACGLAVASLAGGAASAAVVNFNSQSPGVQTSYVDSGFVFDSVRLVNGNCLSGACLALNNNETTTITAQNGGPFTLTSFWFQLLGNGRVNTLTVTADGVAFLFAESAYPHNNGGQFVDLSGNPAFQNITSLVFSTFGGGNVRIDDLNLTPVPLPGALPLMLSALAGGGLLTRRRKAKPVPA